MLGPLLRPGAGSSIIGAGADFRKPTRRSERSSASRRTTAGTAGIAGIATTVAAAVNNFVSAGFESFFDLATNASIAVSQSTRQSGRCLRSSSSIGCGETGRQFHRLLPANSFVRVIQTVDEGVHDFRMAAAVVCVAQFVQCTTGDRGHSRPSSTCRSASQFRSRSSGCSILHRHCSPERHKCASAATIITATVTAAAIAAGAAQVVFAATIITATVAAAAAIAGWSRTRGVARSHYHSCIDRSRHYRSHRHRYHRQRGHSSRSGAH